MYANNGRTDYFRLSACHLRHRSSTFALHSVTFPLPFRHPLGVLGMGLGHPRGMLGPPSGHPLAQLVHQGTTDYLQCGMHVLAETVIIPDSLLEFTQAGGVCLEHRGYFVHGFFGRVATSVIEIEVISNGSEYPLVKRSEGRLG